MARERDTIGGYHSGHPWYYVLGGNPPTLEAIREEVIAEGYGGYMREDIAKADAMPEPKRSDALRQLRAKVQSQFEYDRRIFHDCARELRDYQKEEGLSDEVPVCRDVHVSVSLKYSHLFNDFAHITALDVLLTKQGDLFAL